MFCIDFRVISPAFADKGPIEIISILLIIAQKVAKGRKSGIIRDRDGNAIGDWAWRQPEKG